MSLLYGLNNATFIWRGNTVLLRLRIKLPQEYVEFDNLPVSYKYAMNIEILFCFRVQTLADIV